MSSAKARREASCSTISESPDPSTPRDQVPDRERCRPARRAPPRHPTTRWTVLLRPDGEDRRFRLRQFCSSDRTDHGPSDTAAAPGGHAHNARRRPPSTTLRLRQRVRRRRRRPGHLWRPCRRATSCTPTQASSPALIGRNTDRHQLGSEAVRQRKGRRERGGRERRPVEWQQDVVERQRRRTGTLHWSSMPHGVNAHRTDQATVTCDRPRIRASSEPGPPPGAGLVAE